MDNFGGREKIPPKVALKKSLHNLKKMKKVFFR